VKIRDIAESPAQARWVVDQHISSGPVGSRQRCALCGSWWPCDMVGLAALAVHLSEQLRIATETLGYLSRAANHGKPARHMSTMAEDALIQMSVVE
jgi:hypothetical protein